MMLATGQVLQNRYRIVSLLGQGGMGAVYRAWDIRLNVPVALKEMTPQPGLDLEVLTHLRRQFHQEATVLARLDHTNLVRVTDFFEESGNAYLAMDFVKGENLADRIARQGRLPERDVLTWAGQLLDALAYCHGQGVLHRDIKPQNVIVRPDGRAVLVDFGLVKLWDPDDPQTRTVMRGMGTPEYAPPEQYSFHKQHTDPRSDIYSLGATLYHALTGQVPLSATDRMAVPEQFVPLRTLSPEVSERTAMVVTKALELVRSQRWGSAGEMAAALKGEARASRDEALVSAPPGRQPGRAAPAAAGVAVPSRGRRLPTWIWMVGGLVALLLVCLVGAGGLALAGQQGSGPLAALWVTPTYTITPTPTSTLTPTPTPTPTTTPTPTPLPMAGTIVFISDRDSDEHIYVAPADGSRSPTRISNSGLDYAPSWSWATGEIIFISRREGKVDVYSMDADGEQVQRLTDSDPGMTEPLLAPTGDKVAFVLDGAVGWVSLGSGDIQFSDIEWVIDFAWSPDGEKIATIEEVYQSSGSSNVVIQVWDTSRPSASPVTVLQREGDWRSDTLAWSPDGERIAFPMAPDGPDTELGIYVVEADGSGFAKLADVPGAEDERPVWSPDGTELLFVSTSDTRTDDTIDNCDNSVIYRVSVGGGGLARLTDSSVESYEPAWSPDGDRIAYTVFENGGNEIYVMDADGSNKVSITDPEDDADEYWPSWSPDGSMVLFASSRYAPRVYLLTPATGQVQQVASDEPLVVHTMPRLTPDGRYLAFTREYGFSSRSKRSTGGNGGICNRERMVIVSNPRAFAGGEVPGDGLPSTRTLYDWSDDGRWLLYQGWSRSGLRVWDVQAGEYTPVEAPESVYYAALSPSGEHVAYYDYGDNQVHLVSVASGEATNLSVGAEARSYGGVRFSPDGEAVLFSVVDGLQVRDFEGMLLYNIPLDKWVSEHAWLPDGDRVAYGTWSSDAEESTLWVYDLQRGEATQVATVPAVLYDLEASPDGRWLVFRADLVGNDELYAVSTDGGAVINLTNDPAEDDSPVWMP